VAADPRIQECVAGTRVETRDRTGARRQDRYVRYAADVQDAAAGVLRAEQPLVERRHQWRSLSAQRQVRAAETGHAVDPGPPGDDVGVADLQRVGPLSVGPVPERLSVTADGAHPGGIDVRRLQ
jgi:hypothetical protein